MHFQTLFNVIAGIVVISSILSSLLPPWELFGDYPKFQKAYRLAVIILGRWGSLNLKSVVYPQIKNGGNTPT